MMPTNHDEAVPIALGSVVIYARDMTRTAQFYAHHFGFLTTNPFDINSANLAPCIGVIDFFNSHAA